MFLDIRNADDNWMFPISIMGRFGDLMKCPECGKLTGGVTIMGLCTSCCNDDPGVIEMKELIRENDMLIEEKKRLVMEIIELRKAVFYHHGKGCRHCTITIEHVQRLGNDLSKFFPDPGEHNENS